MGIKKIVFSKTIKEKTMFFVKSKGKIYIFWVMNMYLRKTINMVL